MKVSQKVGRETLRVINRFGKSYNDWIYCQIEPFLGKRIIEIGAGIGNISRYLAKRPEKEKLVLSDISSYWLALLKKKFRQKNIQIIYYDLNKLPRKSLLKKNFDTVVCLNVLEHIFRDQKALRNIKKLLVKKGKLILMVPAFQFAYGQLDICLGHFRRYQQKDLKKKLKKAGLEVIKLDYLNFFGLWGWWYNSRLRKRKSLPQKQFRCFVKIFKLIYWFEEFLPLPCGLTCLVIARRK
jgi:2-polyprenyl-3-methyl-5-hydroxy-6-metoxy-1,4-benzoquinol methylase